MLYNGLQKGESLKIVVIGFLLTISLFATYYFQFILKIDIIFTHFFYIPIILASLWWGRKGHTSCSIPCLTAAGHTHFKSDRGTCLGMHGKGVYVRGHRDGGCHLE